MHDLCAAPYVTGVIKSRITRWADRVSRMRRREMHTGFLVVKREGKSPFGRQKRRWPGVKIVLC